MTATKLPDAGREGVGIGADDVIETLGIKATWYMGAFEISAQLGAIDPHRARGAVGQPLDGRENVVRG